MNILHFSKDLLNNNKIDNIKLQLPKDSKNNQKLKVRKISQPKKKSLGGSFGLDQMRKKLRLQDNLQLHNNSKVSHKCKLLSKDHLKIQNNNGYKAGQFKTLAIHLKIHKVIRNNNNLDL